MNPQRSEQLELAARRRRIMVLSVLTAGAALVLTIRWMPSLTEEATANSIVSKVTDQSEELCEVQLLLAARYVGDEELHRDLFQWEDVFDEPMLRDDAVVAELKHEATTSIQVNAVMTGQTPSAVLNGELKREGDVVAGFKVRLIENRRVVVEKNGVIIELAH